MKRNPKQPIAWLLATSLILSGAAWAAPVTVTNPGFEDPPTDDGELGTPGVVPGWSVFNLGAIRVLNPSSAADLTAEAPEGQNVGLVTGSTNEDGYSQTLATSLQADADYVLTVKVANTKFTGGFPGYRVQLLANGTLLAEDDNSQSVAEDTVVTSTVSYSYTVAEAALVGQPLEIRLLSKGLVDGQEVAFDDVQLDVSLLNPAANPGGPYSVAIPDGSLSLDGSASLPSDGQTISTYEWDLDNDGDFDELITGVTPAPIDYATLTAAPPAGFGMVEGENTIKLRVTDSAAKTSTVEGIVNLSQPLLIYEPFADLDPTLAGNTPGLGLSGTWIAESLIAGNSLTYGKLGYQGGRAVANPGIGNGIINNEISPGSTLTDAGLMADGAELWISALIVKHPDTSPSTNDRTTYLSIGTGVADAFDRIGGDTGSGFTFVVNQGNNGTSDRLQLWNNDSDGAGGAEKRTAVPASWGPEGSTLLVVGKITWGAFDPNPATAPDNDVFELYLPDKDLNLGPVVATLTGNFDQLGTVNAANAFDTISFAGKRGGTNQNNVPEVDEIRFGATSAAVLPLDTIAPVLVTTDNASGSGVQRVATFDEEVYAGTGEIRIVNETTPGTTTIIIPDPQVVFSGNTLTITPTVPLVSGTYHIEIDAGAVTDRNLNAFAGISDPDQWEFTVDISNPTVTAFADNTSPKPILTNVSGRLVYTVTFSEAIDPASLTTADFAATAGSVPITVDSVSATGDPAVFEVAVSTGGTTGTLTLEIVAAALITDLNGNPLDTTTAIPSDNTLAVNDPVPNAGSIANDFQGIIASQNNPNNTGSGEGRYFHVSVNEDNPGTGWYCANDTSGTPAAAGWRNYTGPVVAYKMLGNSENSVSGTAGAGGEPDRITYTTNDFAFDGFGQQQMRLWTANDPGADLATGAGTGATGFDNTVGNYGYRDMSGAKGFVDITGLTSGSVHIYYGSYNSTPTLKITLHDSDNVGADIVINDAHSIAGGGNGDDANLGEYYLAEIDFVTDGVYDVLEYEWTSPNGRGLGTVLTGPDAVGNDFATWVGGFTLTDTTFNGDDDGDNLGNGIEAFFGTNPSVSNSGLSDVSKSGANEVTFTHPNPDVADILTDVTGSYEWSLDMVTWYADDGVEGPGATTLTTMATPDDPMANTTTVVATIAGTVPEKLFIRVVATQP